jgi:hypothetical protein
MKLHHHGKSKLNAAEFDYKAMTTTTTTTTTIITIIIKTSQ